MPFQPVVSKKKADYVVDSIFSLVLNEELCPGDRLPPENELAERYQVSRITIREAIKELRLMGIVSVRQGEGTFICNKASDSYLRQLLPIMALKEKDGTDLYDARRYIEMGTTFLAAQRRTEEELLHLERIVTHMNELYTSKKFQTAFSESVWEFHEYIAKISKNEYLYTVFVAIRDILDAYIKKTTTLATIQEEPNKEHNDIFLAIRMKDAELAETLMSKHILGMKTRSQNAFEEQR